MSRKELVQEIITISAPVFIKKALQYLANGQSPQEDEIVTEVIMECEEVVNNELTSSTSGDAVQYAGPYGNLVANLCMIIDDLCDDIKSQIMQELMMKMQVEMAQIKDVITSYTPAKVNTSDDIFHFAVTADDVHIDKIDLGYKSIEKYATKINNCSDNPFIMMGLDAGAGDNVHTHGSADNVHTHGSDDNVHIHGSDDGSADGSADDLSSSMAGKYKF